MTMLTLQGKSQSLKVKNPALGQAGKGEAGPVVTPLTPPHPPLCPAWLFLCSAHQLGPVPRLTYFHEVGVGVSSSTETREQSMGKPILGHREGIPSHPWASTCDLGQWYRPGPTRNSWRPRFSALESDLMSLHVLVNAQV